MTSNSPPPSSDATSKIGEVADPALDMAMIEGLRRGRPDLLKRLIRTYLGYAPKAVEGLHVATAEGAIETVRMTAHSLKSSTASMGAKALSALFKEIEHEATTGNAAALPPLMLRVTAEFARVRTELQAMDVPDEPRKTAQA